MARSFDANNKLLGIAFLVLLTRLENALKRHLAVMGLIVSAPVFGQALEYKGVPLGATAAEFKSEHRLFKCLPDAKDASIESCMGGKALCRAEGRPCYPGDLETSNYAEESVHLVWAKFFDGRFERLDIFFEPTSFSAISGALLAKYGKPTDRRTQPYATVGGVKTTNEVILWSRADGDIMIERYGKSLNEGRLVMVTSKWNSDAGRRDQDKAKARGRSM